METRCHGAKTEFHFTSLVYRGQPTVKPNMVNVLSFAVVLHFFGQASEALSDPSVSNLVRYSKKTENSVTIFLNHPFFSRSLTLRLILPDI